MKWDQGFQSILASLCVLVLDVYVWTSGNSSKYITLLICIRSISLDSFLSQCSLRTNEFSCPICVHINDLNEVQQSRTRKLTHVALVLNNFQRLNLIDVFSVKSLLFLFDADADIRHSFAHVCIYIRLERGERNSVKRESPYSIFFPLFLSSRSDRGHPTNISPLPDLWCENERWTSWWQHLLLK